MIEYFLPPFKKKLKPNCVHKLIITRTNMTANTNNLATQFTDVILLFNTDSTTLEKVWDEVVSIIDGEELDELSDDKTVKIANLITQATDDDDEEDVCCVACGDFVCKFNDEWNLKDEKDECVCEECWTQFYEKSVSHDNNHT